MVTEGRVEWSANWRKDRRASSDVNLFAYFMWLHLKLGEDRPDLAVVERNGWSKNRDASHALARFEAASILACRCRGVRVIEARASQARKRALGNGGLSKPKAAKLARAMFAGHTFRCADEIDAAVLGAAGESLLAPAA